MTKYWQGVRFVLLNSFIYINIIQEIFYMNSVFENCS